MLLYYYRKLHIWHWGILQWWCSNHIP
jgi:hypothetical protein